MSTIQDVGHICGTYNLTPWYLDVSHVCPTYCTACMCVENAYFTETFGQFERLIGAGLADDKVFVLLV